MLKNFLKVIDARCQIHWLFECCLKILLLLIPVPGYETASTPPPDTYGEEVEGLTYTIQVGSFTDRTNAETLQGLLLDMFTDVRIEEFSTTGTTYYRVRVGLFSSRIDAINTVEELTHAGYDGFIVEADR